MTDFNRHFKLAATKNTSKHSRSSANQKMNGKDKAEPAFSIGKARRGKQAGRQAVSKTQPDLNRFGVDDDVM